MGRYVNAAGGWRFWYSLGGARDEGNHDRLFVAPRALCLSWKQLRGRGLKVMVNFAWRRRQRAQNTRNRAALGLIAATAMVVVPWYQARAQNPDSARFDVVSVKRNQLEPRARRPVFGCSAGRFVSQGGTYTGRGILWAFDVCTGSDER